MLPARRSPSPYKGFGIRNIAQGIRGSGIQVSLKKNPESSTLNPESTAWNSLDSLTWGEVSGGSREGPWEPGPPPLIVRRNWGPKSRKRLFGDLHPLVSGSGWLPPSPSPLSQGLDPALAISQFISFKVELNQWKQWRPIGMLLVNICCFPFWSYIMPILKYWATKERS